MAKIVQLERSETVDHETGQVTKETRSTVVSIPSEPPYVKMYIEDLGKLFDVPPGPRNLLYHLVRRLDYEGFISLTPAARERIALACGIDVRTMSNYLTTLCKTDVLRHAGRGEYLMNPNFFARGEWKEIARRREEFVLSITYKPDGTRSMKTRRGDGEQIDLEDFLKTDQG